ncbi:hypothetical protein [Bacillus thuringiensis]|uniref:hypothetical protein n=1 Tax=Bacillus thuringiensis TaxID=1428 RepID=UPI0021D69AC6|nr:hypothetical protein [Bacillus thuringiensis]MCU7666767.1 hypothetical protein [Bacillus thuringiensis]
MSNYRTKRKRNSMYLFFLFAVTSLMVIITFQKKIFPHMSKEILNNMHIKIDSANSSNEIESTNKNIAANIDSPSVNVRNESVLLNGEPYNLISLNSFHDFLQTTIYKTNSIQNVLATALIQKQDKYNNSTKTLKEIQIDYKNLLLLQTTREKTDEHNSKLIQELYLNPDATYVSSYKKDKDNKLKKNNKTYEHKEKLNKDNILESSVKLNTYNSPYHLVRSLGNNVGFLAGVNEKNVILLKKNNREYFDVIQEEIVIYYFDKLSKLPIKVVEYTKNKDGENKTVTKKEIVYSKWNELEKVSKPFGIDF